jgi:tripartite-type tricarboxylate transporter receptor subunit TctC
VRESSAVLAVLLAILPVPAIAQDGEWPTRAARLIVPSGTGGNPDVVARILADRFTSKFGKPFIVENMPGAGGGVAANLIAKARTEGHIFFR